jgi:CheY-like chemotaxis protein
MSGDIISLRLLLVTAMASLRDLLRQGANQASVPAEVVEANSAASVEPLLNQGLDLIFLDGDMSAADKSSICKSARAMKERPFVILLGNDDEGVDVDGYTRKPESTEDAQRLVDSCISARLPARALIIDDSVTMRGIVRKILSASKFPLQISDTQDGYKALEELRDGVYDIVFLDYNMPGIDGFEVLSELQKLQLQVSVVMMASTDNAKIVERAQIAGAAGFLKKPFFPSDIDTVLYRIYNIDEPTHAGQQ